jgi:hypothetical protein
MVIVGWYYQRTSFKAIDYLKESYTHGKWEVIHAEQPNKKEVYMAVRNNETNQVIAMVCLVDEKRGEFGYKPMEEFMEPYYYNASDKLLSLLTPTDDENALNWRKGCMNGYMSAK